MTAPNDIDSTIQAMRAVSNALTEANGKLIKAHDLMRRSGLDVYKDPTIPDVRSIIRQFESLMCEHAALAYQLGQVARTIGEDDMSWLERLQGLVGSIEVLRPTDQANPEPGQWTVMGPTGQYRCGPNAEKAALVYLATVCRDREALDEVAS